MLETLSLIMKHFLQAPFFLVFFSLSALLIFFLEDWEHECLMSVTNPHELVSCLCWFPAESGG